MSAPGAPIVEWHRDGYTVSTDPRRIDLDTVARFLSEESYWATGRSRDVVERSIADSIAFGLYDGGRQAGFARAVTDSATFAWICDVFVMPDWRGRGLGVWLMECVVAHPSLQGLRRMLLGTRDAHELYRRFGFTALPEPERFMIRREGS
jgi:GNAT superfamily N-acetyltransferase